MRGCVALFILFGNPEKFGTYTGAVVANAARHLVKRERGGHLKKNPKESLFTGVFSVVVVAACDKDALDLVMFERMVS